MKTDCLLIGFNDYNFEDYVAQISSMGEATGGFRELNLYFLEHEGQVYHAMSLLNHLRAQSGKYHNRPLHNTDFLWPTITYLGTYLWRRGFSFDYINLFQQEKDLFRQKLLSDDILTVAITTTLYVTPQPIIDIISFIRQYNDRVKIVLGGPYVSNQIKLLSAAELEDLFFYLDADFYVLSSEGELALANIVGALKSGAGLDAIPNVVYKTDEGYVTTAAAPEWNALEENMVNYSLFPKQDMKEFVSLLTSKSCPFSCSFCGFPQRKGKYTYMSVDLVEKELNAIRDLGTVNTLTFLDDTFNVPRPRFKELLRMMIRNNYGFKWNCFYRSDHGDEETIELMAKAGCEGVFLGVESGSDAMLERMNKTSRRKHYLKAIPLLNAAGIETNVSLVLGFPGETEATVQETIDLIEQARPDYYRAQLWYCDPVTPVWNKRGEYGIEGYGFNWSHTTMDFQTACDLIYKMFLTVENSVWLPQNGLEHWSIFYLQRRGMTFDQIKTYLRCFNAAVGRKLVDKGKKNIDPDLLEDLKQASQFEAYDGPTHEPLSAYAGARRVEPEKVEPVDATERLPNVVLV